MDRWEYMNLTIRFSSWREAMAEAGREGWEAWSIRDSVESLERIVHFKRKLEPLSLAEADNLVKATT